MARLVLSVRVLFIFAESQSWRSTAAHYTPRHRAGVWYHHHQLPRRAEQVQATSDQCVLARHLLYCVAACEVCVSCYKIYTVQVTEYYPF